MEVKPKLMFIKREKYKQICELKDELEKEVQRLANQITSQTKDCKMGEWCRDCVHLGRDFSAIEYERSEGLWHSEICGKAVYCKKHLHEICPEFESARKETN